MATIVFMPFHWASDLNPTFALARKLRDHGHRVHFLCIPDTEARIRAQGFEFTPVLYITSSGRRVRTADLQK